MVAAFDSMRACGLDGAEYAFWMTSAAGVKLSVFGDCGVLNDGTTLWVARIADLAALPPGSSLIDICERVPDVARSNPELSKRVLEAYHLAELINPSGPRSGIWGVE